MTQYKDDTNHNTELVTLIVNHTTKGTNHNDASHFPKQITRDNVDHIIHITLQFIDMWNTFNVFTAVVYYNDTIQIPD